mmetsp:Transcript_12667/g.22431  ORF Transcript_12667/g.22431 Transcript_12667/m.22431 type:complete len:225 (+) Transcript_12667:177-851(+)
MEAVLGLVEDDRLRPIDHLSCLLLAAHGGQAVHEVRVGRCVRHEIRCHLVRLECRQTLRSLLASDAVRHPRVSVDDICASHRFLRRLEHSRRTCAAHTLELRTFGQHFRLGQEVRRGRRGHAHVHAHDDACAHQIVGHVVTRITRVRQRHSREVEATLLFGDRLKVREHLHRVRKVVEGVDDGDGRVLGETGDLAAVVHARGHRVHHAGQHGARVLVGLLLADR